MGRRNRGSVGSVTSRAVAVAVLIASLSSVAMAGADADKKKAQALQVEGLRLMQAGDNRGALDKFEEAFRLVPSPKILFNRGKAHQALGEGAAALSDFERFLDEAPYAPKESRAEASRSVEALRPTLSYLEVQTDDVGSTIAVDGHEIRRCAAAASRGRRARRARAAGDEERDERRRALGVADRRPEAAHRRAPDARVARCAGGGSPGPGRGAALVVAVADLGGAGRRRARGRVDRNLARGGAPLARSPRPGSRGAQVCCSSPAARSRT